MTLPKIRNPEIRILFILFFIGVLPSHGFQDWTGTWEGSMGTGPDQFRVAFVLGREGGEYHNIDDGIHGEPLTVLSMTGSSIRAQTTGGGTLVLNGDERGNSLIGAFTQGPGADSKQSLVGEGKTYPVTLQRGQNDLKPRLLPDGSEQTIYRYGPPIDLSDGWKTGDLRKNKAALSVIEKVVRHILNSDYPRIHGLVVVKDGKLVVEEYFYGYGPGDSHPVQSVTKPLFSLLFGIAEAQGLCHPDQKLFDYFPSYRQKAGWDPGKDKVSLKMLLTMTSGLGCDDFKDPSACSWAMVGSPDWLDFSLSLPLGEEPGSHFAYCGACLTPLGAILEKQSGLKLPDYAQKFLFDPLGIDSPHWWEGSHGFHSPAFGLFLKPRDMAKIGYLVLKKGKWNGKQVVPEKWIEESTAPQVPGNETGKKADYGYLWWEEGAGRHGEKLRVLDAWGVGGQHIFIAPRLDLVCVVTGGNYKDGPLANHSFKIFKDVARAFK
jgi:CubicO group peptidase (beta-lactamase class C family)